MWSPNKYTITYNCDGGTNTPASQTVSYNGKYTVPASVCKKTGYTHVGWVDPTGDRWDSGWSTNNWKYQDGDYGIMELK